MPFVNKREVKTLIAYVFEKDKLRTFQLVVKSAGFGMGDMGAARADQNSEFEHVWFGNKAFGYAMGLDLARWVASASDVPRTCWSLVRGGNQTETKTFFRTCDTTLTHARPIKEKTAYPASSEVVLFKRFLGQAENLYAPSASISHDPNARRKWNWPYQPRGIRLTDLLAAWDGKDLAVLRNPNPNEVKKRKGRDFKMVDEDEDQMEISDGSNAPGIHVHRSGTGRGKMPRTPTAKANEILSTNQKAAVYAKARFKLDTNQLRTQQEWCHLVATSLGGTEEFHNFVLGSDHCNTEQLAIETVLLASQSRVKKKKLTVKLSAYLVPGTTLLGELIRYKIYIDGVKLFDHVIDAQSESFSLFEFKILQATVDRVISVALGESAIQDYEQRMNARIQKRKMEESATDVLTYAVPNELKTQVGG